MRKTFAAACVAMILGGCTSYYKVHDPTTNKDYYTTNVNERNGGATTLKDGRTGKTVTLQNSEVSKLSKEEYDSGRYAAQADNAAKQPEKTMNNAGAATPAPNPFK